MASGIELQHVDSNPTQPSWLALPEEYQRHAHRQQRRIRIVLGLCASIALVGSLSIAALNVLAVKPSLSSTFEPSFPIFTPLLFCILSAGTAVGMATTVYGRNSPVPVRQSQLSGFESLRATGRHFHNKVVLLEVLQLMNQCRNLVTLLFMGQTAFWVCAHSGLICLNAVVTPILHFSPRIQSNTFFLTIFDAVMDTTFGAVLPACMLAEVATWFVTDSEMEMATHRSPRAIQKLIQASMIARGLVPTSAVHLTSLAWPFISLNIKLRDLQDARELWSQSSALDRRRRPLGPWLFGAPFLLCGLSVGVLGMTARVRSPCWKKSWKYGCQQQRFDLLGRACECAAYVRRNVISISSESALVEMVQESSSLEVLILESCIAGRSKIPSLAENVKLRYLFLTGNSLSQIPAVNKLVELRELRVGYNELHTLPDLSFNTALQVLSAEFNHLTAVPNLEKHPNLKVLRLGGNRISQPPNLFANTELLALGLHQNSLREAPSLETNHKLTELSLSMNHLTSLPSYQHLGDLEILHADRNGLERLPPLSNLQKLHELILSDNQLEELPSLDSNVRLKLLDVSANRLSSLPSLAGMPNLQQLRAGSNALSELPPVSPDARLSELRLGGNKLRRLDLSEPPFRSLSILEAHENRLEDMPGLDGLTALRELYLGGNLLSELPILSAPNLVVMEVAWNRLRELSVQTFPRLQWLDASSNQLRSTEGLDKLEDLQLLILQNNSLTELPDMMANCSLVSLLVGFNLLTELGSLPQGLKQLNASSNRLRELPPNMVELEFLLSLDVSDNELKSLQPLEMGPLPNLQAICAANNQLRQLPSPTSFRSLRALGCAGNPLAERPEFLQFLACDCCSNRNLNGSTDVDVCMR